MRSPHPIKRSCIDAEGVVYRRATAPSPRELTCWTGRRTVRAATYADSVSGYDYPPDAEAKAVELVLEQAELFANGKASAT